MASKVIKPRSLFNEIERDPPCTEQEQVRDFTVDTIQDFLCKLGMKPNLHLVEISIFSLHHIIVRPTKIIKDLCEAKT